MTEPWKTDDDKEQRKQGAFRQSQADNALGAFPLLDVRNQSDNGNSPQRNGATSGGKSDNKLIDLPIAELLNQSDINILGGSNFGKGKVKHSKK